MLEGRSLEFKDDQENIDRRNLLEILAWPRPRAHIGQISSRKRTSKGASRFGVRALCGVCPWRTLVLLTLRYPFAALAQG
jgi:hypothetical protein